MTNQRIESRWTSKHFLCGFHSFFNALMFMNCCDTAADATGCIFARLIIEIENQFNTHSCRTLRLTFSTIFFNFKNL